MTAANVFACFKETESFEGGYANNSHDPGGATMKGVTQATYSAWLKKRGRPDAAVKTASDADIEDIYLDEYWNPVRGDNLYDGLDLVVVDTGWGSGPVTAVKILQRALGVAVDGQFGPRTLAAVKARWNSPDLINTVCSARMEFFQSLPTWKYFGAGWTRRLNGIQVKALEMNAAARKGNSVNLIPINPNSPGATATISPPTPTSPARVVPTASQPVRNSWRDWLAQFLAHETPMIESGVQVMIDTGADALPGGLGFVLTRLLGPTIVKNAVDGILTTVEGVLVHPDPAIQVSTGAAVETMVKNTLQNSAPEFVARAGDLLEGWIKSALAAKAPK